MMIFVSKEKECGDDDVGREKQHIFLSSLSIYLFSNDKIDKERKEKVSNKKTDGA